MEPNINLMKPDSAIVKYIAVASVLLLIFTVIIPSLGVSFGLFNLIFLAVWYLFRKEKPGERCIKYIVGGIVLGNAFLCIYMHFQNFIPFWDYAGYYKETLRSGALLEENIPAFFRALYESMLTSDYTLLPTLFIAPLLRLLGGSFTVYIFLIYNAFLVPFFILFGILVNDINRKCVPLMFLFTPFVSPALRGYLDGEGLLYVAVWLFLIHRRTFRKLSVKEDIILGVLSVLMIFTRRWYLFFLVGAFLALALSGLVRRAYDKRFDLKILFQNLLYVGGTVLLIIVVFFTPYLIRLLKNDMAEAYSAYMFGSFWWNVKYFIRYYGFLPMLFYALGFVGLRRRRFRQLTLFLLFHIPIMFFLFTRIQTVSYHHQYLFAAEMFLLAAVGIASLPKYNSKVLIAFAVTLSLSFVYIYVPSSTDFLRNVFSSVRFAPKTMETEGVIALRDKLNALVEAEGGNVYVLASSETLNDDMLNNSLLPKSEAGVPSLLGTNHVDKRDGMPNHLFVSKFIVVADPVQVHLGTENQQVVDYFAREILDGTFTPNLERIESIPITREVTAHIYRRNSGFTEEFLNRTQAHFASLYPALGDRFAVDFVWSQNN